MGPDQMSDYHESSEESEDIQEIRDSLALLENLFVCDGDFKGVQRETVPMMAFGITAIANRTANFKDLWIQKKGKSWKTSITWSPSAMDD